MGRICLVCKEYKEAEFFTPFKEGKNGLYPHCKNCRVFSSKRQWIDKTYPKKIFDRAKTRASRKGLEFSISLEDIIIPDVCPVLKTKMETPSIDRIDSSKGYIKGNIRIISNRANMLKNNATLEEMRLIVADLEVVSVGRVTE